MKMLIGTKCYVYTYICIILDVNSQLYNCCFCVAEVNLKV